MKKFRSIFLASFIFIPMLFKMDINQELGDGWLQLNKDSTIEQSFISNKDNLYEVRFYFNKHDLGITSPMLFTLSENSSRGPVIRSLSLDAKNIGSNYWLKLTFPPISDSGGKQYYAKLEAPTLLTNDLEIMYTRSTIDNYRGQGFVNDIEIEGNLRLRTFYKSGVIDFLWEIIDNTKQRLASDRSFFVFYAILHLFITGMLIFVSIKKER